jgi:hypothetical protein
VGQSASISVKALALSVLAASKTVPAHALLGTGGGTGSESTRPLAERESQTRQPGQLAHLSGLAACGSPECDGCYDVGDGRKIHPPKSSPEWLAWLERWEPKGIPQ